METASQGSLVTEEYEAGSWHGKVDKKARIVVASAYIATQEVALGV